MASCVVGLGPSILTKVGLQQIRGTNPTIDGFIDALSQQLSSFFKAGAVANTRELTCGDDATEQLAQTFDSTEISLASLLNVPKTAFPAVDLALDPRAEERDTPNITEAVPVTFTKPVRYRLASGVTALGIELFTPSAAAYMATASDDVETCCTFFGPVTSFGDVGLKLTIMVKYGAIDVTVGIDLGYTTRIAGTTHRGMCNPPKVCRSESVAADILVTYTGKLNVKVAAEIDLGPLGKVRAAGAGLDLSAQGVDIVTCTLTC